MWIYIFVFAGIFIAVIAFLKYSNSAKRNQIINDIRGQWGNLKAENTHVERMDFDGIARFAAISPLQSSRKISPQLTTDIDFFQLFAFVDRTTSRVGQQYLFRKLLFPQVNSDHVKNLESLVNCLSDKEDMRLAIQLQLARLKERGTYHIANLFQPGHLSKSKWIIPPWISLVVFAIMAASTFWSMAAVVFLPLPLLANLFLHYWNKRNTFHLFRSIPQLMVMLGVVEEVLALTRQSPLPGIQHSMIEDAAKRLSLLRRKVLFVDFSQGNGLQDDINPVGTVLNEFVKGALLIEVYTYNAIVNELNDKYYDLERVFDFVGRVDTAISIASLRAGKHFTCQPEIHDELSLSITNMRHPLVTKCAPNSIVVEGKSVLITGSNMSGKTTFLRTLVINALLAQTINTCFAERFHVPILQLSTYIRVDDDLLSGSSYFFREVEMVREMIEASETGYNLFVLDELFKGTNTIERIASAKAVLAYLHSRNNLVFISTHDLELVDLLADKFDLYHFTETIANDELQFDHKLKKGPLTTRNAVKILQITGYPSEITEDALKLSQAMLQNSIKT
jgi:MutS domain V